MLEETFVESLGNRPDNHRCPRYCNDEGTHCPSKLCKNPPFCCMNQCPEPATNGNEPRECRKLTCCHNSSYAITHDIRDNWNCGNQEAWLLGAVMIGVVIILVVLVCLLATCLHNIRIRKKHRAGLATPSGRSAGSRCRRADYDHLNDRHTPRQDHRESHSSDSSCSQCGSIYSIDRELHQTDSGSYSNPAYTGELNHLSNTRPHRNRAPGDAEMADRNNGYGSIATTPMRSHNLNSNTDLSQLLHSLTAHYNTSNVENQTQVSPTLIFDSRSEALLILRPPNDTSELSGSSVFPGDSVLYLVTDTAGESSDTDDNSPDATLEGVDQGQHSQENLTCSVDNSAGDQSVDLEFPVESVPINQALPTPIVDPDLEGHRSPSIFSDSPRIVSVGNQRGEHDSQRRLILDHNIVLRGIPGQASQGRSGQVPPYQPRQLGVVLLDPHTLEQDILTAQPPPYTDESPPPYTEES